MLKVENTVFEYLTGQYPKRVVEKLGVEAVGVVGPLYHLSTDPKLKTMTPRVSRRTMGDEDISIPRICTSTSVVGTLMGYMAHWYDIDSKPRADKDWKGSWVVYGFDYEFAVKPDKTMVPDVEISDEWWLLAYPSKGRQEYKTKKLAEIHFYRRTVQSGFGRFTADMELIVHAKEPIRLQGKKTIPAGYSVLKLTEVQDDSVSGFGISVKSQRTLSKEAYREMLDVVKGGLKRVRKSQHASSGW